MSEVAVSGGNAGAEGEQMERVLEGSSLPLTLLTAMRAITRSADRVYLWMGYLCGGIFLMLGLFITYQVVARKIGWAMAPGMDLMSGFALAMAVTWAFSYALRTGSHVRIDVLLPFMPPKIRAVADWMALFSIFFFVAITAWKTWEMTLKSYEIGAVTNTYPLTPLWAPQVVVAIGFSMLGLTALHMMVNSIAEGALPVLHKMAGGTETYRPVATTAVIQEESGGAI